MSMYGFGVSRGIGGAWVGDRGFIQALGIRLGAKNMFASLGK